MLHISRSAEQVQVGAPGVRRPPSPNTAVIGMVLYNHADRLPEAIESILCQTHQDVRLVLVDDESADETPAICERYQALDDRVTYLRNAQRRGMIGNWRWALRAATQLYPEAPFYAWASDHDMLHPRWLESCVHTLQAHPDAVLVYPRRVALDADDLWRGTNRDGYFGWTFETEGVRNPLERMDRGVHGMSAGSMVYGLFRAAVLDPAMLNYVYLPDRLFLSRLALAGEFWQVHEAHYYRRWGGAVTLERQFRGMFPGASQAPRYLGLPWWLTHAGVLFRDLVLQGRGRPRVGRALALAGTLTYLVSTAHYFTQRTVSAKTHLWGRQLRGKLKELRGLRNTLIKRLRARFAPRPNPAR